MRLTIIEIPGCLKSDTSQVHPVSQKTKRAMKKLLVPSLISQESSTLSRKLQPSIFNNKGDTPQKFPVYT